MKTLYAAILLLQFITHIESNALPEQQDNSPRIIGGSPADLNQIYYYVSIQLKEPTVFNHICGGAIVSPKSVVTTARCLHYTTGTQNIINANNLQVVTNTTSIASNALNKRIHAIKEVITHKKFSMKNTDHDIGLLIIIDEFNFTTTIKPIPIRSGKTITGEYCVVSGYGATSVNGQVGTSLLKVTVPIVKFDVCKKSYKNGIVTSRMICAAETGKDFCNGDFGAPLICYGELAGIAAQFNNCNQGGIPGVYTEIANYREWIMRNKASSLKNSIMGIISISVLVYLIQ